MINNFELIKETVKQMLEDKKAEKIVAFDVSACRSKISDVCIIASGTSARHMGMIGDYIYRYFKKAKLSPSLEGNAKNGWVLVSACGIEVHLFKPDIREYYDLEKLIAGSV